MWAKVHKLVDETFQITVLPHSHEGVGINFATPSGDIEIIIEMEEARALNELLTLVLADPDAYRHGHIGQEGFSANSQVKKPKK